MAKAAQSPQLKAAFEKHETETESAWNKCLRKLTRLPAARHLRCDHGYYR
jgi:ferritin-like metal-binding protein YciE